MKINMGTIDRVIRIIVGLALIGAAAGGQIGLWGWLGVIPLATASIGYCPAYQIFGFTTCPRKN
jgi:hypothetical protein